MTGRRTAVIIANPRAGRTSGPKQRSLLNRAAQRIGCEIRGLDTGSPQEMGLVVQEASKEFSRLIAAGGDGTFNLVINNLQGDPVLGYLPLGTGNALHHALGRPSLDQAYFDRLQQGDWREVFPITIDGGQQALFAGIGLDAEAIHHSTAMAGNRSHSLGHYIRACFRSLGTYRPPTISLENGPSMANCLGLVVATHPFYGFGARVMPEAELGDQTLHARLIGPGWQNLPLALVAGLMGFRHPGTYLGSPSINAVSSEPIRLQADGESVRSGTDFRFEISARPIRLVV